MLLGLLEPSVLISLVLLGLLEPSVSISLILLGLLETLVLLGLLEPSVSISLILLGCIGHFDLSFSLLEGFSESVHAGTLVGLTISYEYGAPVGFIVGTVVGKFGELDLESEDGF